MMELSSNEGSCPGAQFSSVDFPDDAISALITETRLICLILAHKQMHDREPWRQGEYLCSPCPQDGMFEYVFIAGPCISLSIVQNYLSK